MNERERVEKEILEKLYEIWTLYKAYCPGGNYLTASVIFSKDGNGNDDGNWDTIGFSVNNAYWEEDSEESAKPLSAHGWIDLPGEKWDACSHEDGDIPGVPSWREND